MKEDALFFNNAMPGVYIQVFFIEKRSTNMYSKKEKFTTHQLIIISLLAGVAFVTMLVGRVPMIQFLKYDPKDVVIMISGMAFGPWTAVIISIVVSFVEFVTVSGDGPIGLLMNVLSTVAYVVPAVMIYRKDNSTRNLIIGLIVGTMLTTLTMIGWNYIVTPYWLGIPRPAVIEIIIYAIIPFNIIKYSINSGIVVLIQKPVLKVFKRSNLIDREVKNQNSSIYLLAVIVIVSAISVVLLINNM